MADWLEHRDGPPPCTSDKPLLRTNTKFRCTHEPSIANNGEAGIPAEDFMRFADAVRNNITGAK